MQACASMQPNTQASEQASKQATDNKQTIKHSTAGTHYSQYSTCSLLGVHGSMWCAPPHEDVPVHDTQLQLSRLHAPYAGVVCVQWAPHATLRKCVCHARTAPSIMNILHTAHARAVLYIVRSSVGVESNRSQSAFRLHVSACLTCRNSYRIHVRTTLTVTV